MLGGALFVLLAPVQASTAMPGSTAGSTSWVTAWTAPIDYAGPPATPGTLRQVLRIGAPGHAVRIRISNQHGTTPLLIDHLHIARSAGGSSTMPGTDHVLNFDGHDTVTVPAGETRLSDATAIDVRAGEPLTVSLHLPAPTGASSLHATAMATTWLHGGTVDHGADTAWPAPLPASGAGGATSPVTTDDSRWFVTAIEVAPERETHALVILGDSISDGVGSTPDTDGRWPDRLAERLRATPGLDDVVVLNASTAGNRLRRPGRDLFIGPAAIERLDSDALDLPGARAVLVFMGINDLSAADYFHEPAEDASAE